MPFFFLGALAGLPTLAVVVMVLPRNQSHLSLFGGGIECS
jgi:hypothetical protein